MAHIPPHLSSDRIPAIFNYCSRWCERCPFTARCANYDPPATLASGYEKRAPVPVVMRSLPTHLAEVCADLKTACERGGYDWQTVKCGLDEAQPGAGELKQSELGEVATSFTVQLTQWLKIYQESEPEVRPSWREALPVLKWYGLLVASKIGRALIGLELAMFDEPPENGPNNIRSDGNATAKIASLALVRALGALGVMLRNPLPFEEELLTFTLDMLRLQQSLRHLYPYAATFERPGFDDPDLLAELDTFYAGHRPLDPFRDGPWQARGGRAPQD